jgi:excisionase family DNA binding protein
MVKYKMVLKVRKTKEDIMRASGLLSVPESAEYLGLKMPTLRAWILRRRIPFVRLGRRVFLRKESLDQLIQQGSVPPRAAR